MLLDDIAQHEVPHSPFSAETLEKIEDGVIVDVSDGPVNTGGSYGDLFSGYHTVLGLKVAMKRPRELLRRSFREGHTWMIFRDIQHPNILPFLGIYEHDSYHHLVSPFMENGTLDDYLVEHLDADRTKLLRQAAGGLVHMHGLKIVHGDIKANNILVTPHGRVFVCDFGLSQIMELRSVDGAYSITSLGNLRWASPEQLLGSEQDGSEDVPKTFQSDVWAFGMTIYQVLSGKLPYSGKREVAIIRAIITGSVPEQQPLSSPSGVSYEYLWQVSTQCLRRDPSDRSSMMEVSSCLGDNYDREVSSFGKMVELDNVLIADHPKHGMVVLNRFRRTPKVRENGLPYPDFQVELWASLKHPNILPFLGICVVGVSHRPFLMSSHMDQGTIKDYVAVHPEKSRTELLCQAALGLMYLHDELIVHGEIRAENFLMSGVGRVLISGFGSSALVGGTMDSQSGPPVQMARWNSPEVLKGGSKTFSSDVYAFGMAIYEVLSGQIPFAEIPTDEEVVVAVLHHDSRPPYWGDPTLSDCYEATWNVVGKCWIPDWNCRPLMPEVIYELRKADAMDPPVLNASVSAIEKVLEETTLSNIQQGTSIIRRFLQYTEGPGQSLSHDPSQTSSEASSCQYLLTSTPKLQYGSTFLSCPVELIVKILAMVSGADLLNISVTCLFLFSIVQDAAPQYHLELFKAGLVDEYDGPGLAPIPDRLKGLRQQADRWMALRWLRCEVLHPRPVNLGNFWDLKSGAYFRAGLDHSAEQRFLLPQLWQFPSLWRGITNLTEVSDKVLSTESFWECSMDPDQDLLILFEEPVLQGVETESSPR